VARPAAARADLVFEFDEPRIAEAVYRALLPECGQPADGRAAASARVRKRVLCLRVEAKDTAALRAAVNTFVRLVKVARDAVERCGEWRNSPPSSGTSSRSSSSSSSRRRRS
jgi:tRNA threonylcarbamoyladenosine modification (KEOPS) complex  Pcc1 subunit